MALLAVAVVWPVSAQPKPGKISDFMRQKLGYSQRVLEGLALEDYSAIADNAHALNVLSEMADWRVLPGTEYVAHSSEFQRITNELAVQANRKNLDGATLAYVQLTLNCVKCHKHVRAVRGPAPKAK
jgi:hypothetical protein